MLTTLGRELIRAKLPEKFKGYADQTLDKKALTALMTEIAKDDPEGYIDVLQDLNNIGQEVVSTYGRDTSLSYADLKVDNEIKSLNKMLRKAIKGILNDDSLTSEQKEEKIKSLGYRYTQKVQDAVFQDQDRRGTSLASQINSGSRGNKAQLMQLQFGNMLMKDALNRDIPYLMLDPFVHGASPMSYWVSASSGRKGFYDVQAATGQAGYLGKQVTAATHRTIIEKEDCGTTDTGVPFPADSSKNVGAVLLRPFHKYPAGTVVTEKMVAEADPDEEMILRSPTTCKCKEGICAKCNGLGENGKFPAIGEYVPLNAARSFVEPVTQGGISCLHPGTQVRMADWSIKALRDVQVGDQVMGVHMDGTYEPALVTRTFDQGIVPMYLTKFSQGIKIGKIKALASTTCHKMLLSLAGGPPKITEVGTKGELVAACQVTGPATQAERTRRPLLERVYQEYIGDMPALDIEVDNDSHLFLLANGLIVSNSKHGAGLGGKKYVDPDGPDQPHGFRSLERLFMAPKNFPGGAVLAPQDGIISNVQKASQGGHYITIGNNTLYCSPDRTITVKPGDKVSAGDVLTNGVPNPAEVMDLKGLGEGRRYFTNKLNEVLKSQGWATDRRNLEAFTRSMISKVKITDPDGYKAYLPGDIVDYNELVADYEPREGSVTVDADKALNKYLEKPALYFSVGTRVTPAVAQQLKKYKFDTVTVSDKEPPFKAQFLRPAVVLQNDRNWLPRLAGERLQPSLFDAAQKGITDEYDSSSYVDKIVAAPFKP